ncbi:MAG: energy transducer TonB [Bryobacteraceae bacterium]
MKARALAVSLTTQTAAAGILLLIPLIYTDRLLTGHITLPATLSLIPKAVEHPTERPAPRPRRTNIRPFAGFFAPTEIPKRSPNIETIDEPIAGEPFVFAVPPLLPGTAIPRVGIIDVPPPPPVKATPVEEPQRTVTVGGMVLAAKLIHRVVPVYPLPAKVARVSGTVRLMGIVSTEGTIQQLQLISGNPLLVQAAMDAVRQWVYSPTLLNGKPTEVIAPIDVIFALSQ